MDNDISTNQALQLPPLPLYKNQQLIPKNSEVNDLVFSFNDSDYTAFVTGNIVDYANVFLPLSIKRGLKEYYIIGIKEGSFESSSLASFQFPRNSNVQIIEKKHFEILGSNPLQSPNKFFKICESSFSQCDFFHSIKFSENSILQTIGPHSFARSSITYIKIPPHVTEICESAFYKCFFLSVIEFSENSELKTIEKEAFSGTSINEIKIPPLFTNAKILVQLNFLKIQNSR